MKNNKILIIILIICLVILVFGGLGYYILNKSKDKKTDDNQIEENEYIKHANDPNYYIDGKLGVGMIINY